MPPKEAKACKVKLKGSAPGGLGQNAAFYAATEADIKQVLAHPIFADLGECEPLRIKAGAGSNSGVQSIFDLREMTIALEQRGAYKAAGNLGWVDPLFAPIAGVPIRRSSVEMLKNYYFQEDEPGLFPRELVLFVTDPKKDPRDPFAMKCVSPDELRAAAWARIRERIDEKAPDEELQKWKNMLLTVSFHIKLIDGDEDSIMALALSEREHIKVEHQTISRTCRQWVFTIVAIKESVDRRFGTTSHEELAEHINSQVKVAPGMDDEQPLNCEITVTMITAAVDVYNMCFAENEARV